MSASSSPFSASDPVVALRRKHQALLARIGSEPPVQEEREAFMAELQAAGRFLPDDRDDKRRSAVRNMLFYWVGDAGTRGERPKDAPLPQLDAFTREGAAGAESPPEREAPDIKAPARETGSVASDGTGRVDAVLTGDQTAGSSKTALDNVLGSVLGDPAIGSGVLSSIIAPTAKGGAILGEFVGKLVNPYGKATPAPQQGDVSPAKPQDNIPLTDIEAMARARIILRYSGYARLWKLADPAKQADYLLKGSQLTEASLYVGDDPDIRSHVEASEAARKSAQEAEHREALTQQKRRITALSVILVFAMVMAGMLWWKSYQLTIKSNQLESKSTELQNALDKAENARKTAEAALEARDKADREKVAAFEVLEDRDRNERLDKRQETYEPPTASNVSEAPRRSASPLELPVDVPRPLAVAEPCSGYLWFGSATDSRLIGGQSPASLKPGDRATVSFKDDLRLRETPPTFNYQMGRQIGLVPAGGTVTISELLAPYPRPSGTQYWTQVLAPRQFCTNVFVQFSGTSPTKLDAIKGELLSIGVQTPPAEQLQSASGKAEVRYYWTADAPIAEQVAASLAKFTRDGKPLRLTPLIDFPPAAKARATTIEVWIDLDGLKP